VEGKNNDFKECFLEIDGKKVLNFAYSYGFRNIQKIIRLFKKKDSCKYHFIEIMAWYIFN
jgi:hypothetical protein